VLSNSVYTFQSGPCTVVTPSAAVRCLAPPGVGANHTVTLVVDGVVSAPYPNRTLSYAAPTLTSVEVLAGPGDARATVDAIGTAGGSVVAIRGLVRDGPHCVLLWSVPRCSVVGVCRLLTPLPSPTSVTNAHTHQNFGPSGLVPQSLGLVTFSPVGFTLPTGGKVRSTCSTAAASICLSQACESLQALPSSPPQEKTPDCCTLLRGLQRCSSLPALLCVRVCVFLLCGRMPLLSLCSTPLTVPSRGTTPRSCAPWARV
jgi:hypothetical protein